MNKAELVAGLEEKLGGKEAASGAVEAIIDVIIREVAAGRKVKVTGFGIFEKVSRAARTGRNPRTGETVKINQTSVAKFKPGTAFKTAVSDPRTIPKTGNAGGRAAAGTATASAGAAKKATAKKATGTNAAVKSPTAKRAAAKKTPAKKTTAK